MGRVHTLSQSDRGGRPMSTLFPLSRCRFFSCHSYFTGAQLSCFYSKHHKFASACSLQTRVVAIVSFYKLNNRALTGVPRELSINSTFDASLTKYSTVITACVIMLSLVEDFKESILVPGTVMGPTCSINVLGHSVISDPASQPAIAAYQSCALTRLRPRDMSAAMK